MSGWDGPDDRELLRRYREGDREAFEAFYRRHKDGLYRFLVFACRDEGTAQELVQRTFLRLVEKMQRMVWLGTDHPKRWLYKVGLNLWRDELRRRGHERRMSENDEKVPDLRQDPEKVWEERTADAVRKAVGELPVKYREVVSLHHLAGLDCRETAKVLGVPVGTVKSRLAKAMDVLASRLKGYRP